MTTIRHRPLYEIASDIWEEIRMGRWARPSANYAIPYISAMTDLDQVTDSYLNDSGKSVVLYFLSNASTWRGETARRIKAELKEIVK